MPHLKYGPIGVGLMMLSGCGLQGYISGEIPTSSSASSSPGTQSAPNTGSTGTTGAGGTGTGSTPSMGNTGSTGGTPSGGTPATTCTTTADTFANFADAALDQWCNDCHSGEWNTVAKASAKRQSLRGQISAGLMPPGGNLDSTVKARLLAWLNCPTPLP